MRMKRYKGTGDEIPPLPITVGDVEEFEVERIDSEQLNSLGGKEYRVKWYGYADKERTWEPLANLEHADRIQ
jgi:Chromo (CHRromatin Organisation MOdifier) domain